MNTILSAIKRRDTEIIILAAWVLLAWLSYEAGVADQAVEQVSSKIAGLWG